MKFSRLTTSGNVNNAVISPDQRFIVYSQRERGKQSLWMSQIATASTIQILPPAEVFFIGLTLSKDGNYLYYVVMEAGSSGTSLYKVPLLGGTSKKTSGGRPESDPRCHPMRSNSPLPGFIQSQVNLL